jgi:hypothetical protein
MYQYYPLYMSQSIKGDTQVAEQSVWFLHAFFQENRVFELSIRGHIYRHLMLTQCEFSVDTQCYVCAR